VKNVHVVSRPFHAHSNGLIGFSVSQILCTGKWLKLFTETDLVFNPYLFSAYRTELTGKPRARFERVKNTGLETSL
jgi:hypothetical protein